jgi:two-component system KDP operon response regulator KdpE
VTRVLVVEDEPQILRALALNLTARGYDVLSAPDGTTALTHAAGGDIDLVLLDLGLPDMDGLDVIRALRTSSAVPIVVLSARASSGDTVTALDRGADDYVTKPFDMPELLARLRAATRRSQRDPVETVVFGEVTVDLAAKTVVRADEPVHLTPTEWHLLEALVRHPGRLVTQRRLLTLLRGDPGHTDPSYLRIYVAQLRRKLEQEPSRPRHLITEPGMGYRFEI